jgi:hypothetical protein
MDVYLWKRAAIWRDSLASERSCGASSSVMVLGGGMFSAVVNVGRSGYNRVGGSAFGEIMGIRFFCPNGHKLNVKDFQAGQIGFCPFCGVKMPIPLESTRLSTRQQRAIQKGAGVVAGPASQTMARQAAWPAPANRVAPGDPLAEAGDVVWYVHPPSGGQFGPAAANVIRAWITEGRIGANSLVWHEGWPEWQMAGDVFPYLSPARASHEEPEGLQLVVAPVRTSVVPDHRGRGANIFQIVFVGLLTLAVIALFFTLKAVFSQ